MKLKIGAAVAAALALIALLAGYVRLVYSDEALPGTEVGGVSVTGMSADEIRDRLDAGLGDGERPLRVRAGRRELRIQPGNAGREVDVDATVERAMESGREGVLGGLPATLAGLAGSREVELVIGVEPDKLRRSVTRLAGRIDQPPFPGRLLFSADATGATGIEQPRPGREVDRAKLTNRLRRALLDPSISEITAPIEHVAVVSRQEVEEVARKADRLLERPLKIGARQLERAELAGILRLEPLDESRSATLGVQGEKLGELVASIASQRDRDAVNAKLEAPAAPPASLSEQGDVSWRPVPASVSVRPSRPGRTVDRAKLAAAIERAVGEEKPHVPLPVEPVRPEVTTRQARKVNQLIGTFTTYFDPGLPRVTNIQTMARTVNGTLVPAGGSFSLNGRVGQRTRAKGYVPAPMIADGKLVDSVGGGVSQFSTTTYNAAFFAGIQIDAFQPHSFYIDRYPAGRESTLDYPSIDMAWTNDTGAPILIVASADDTSVTVSLYGHNGGRRVSSESGPRRNVPGADFSIDVTRIIRFPGGPVERRTHTITYQKPED